MFFQSYSQKDIYFRYNISICRLFFFTIFPVEGISIKRIKISFLIGTAGTSGNGGDGSVATSAYLNFPYGLAGNGSRVFIADNSNNCVRRVDSGKITTIAGSYYFSLFTLLMNLFDFITNYIETNVTKGLAEALDPPETEA